MMDDSGKSKVLIVDDTPENIQVLMETLKDKYKIVTAINGQKALQMAAMDPVPDIILLDIMMPGLDGYQVCKKLKADDKTRNIPVIFVTAMTAEDDEQKGLDLGAVDYITKPFVPGLIKSRVRNHLELKRHRDHLEELIRKRTHELERVNEELKKDITKRKQAEEKITRFARIFEDSLNEIYLFDADTLKFTQVNSAAQHNLGYTMEELRQLTPLDLNPEFTTESFAKSVVPLRKGEKKKIVFETVHQRKDQSRYDVEVHLQLLKYKHKALFAAIILDITEKLKLEEQFRQAQKMEAVGTLAGGVAHDFNNILTTIIGNVSLALMEIDKDGPLLEELVEIKIAGERAAALTRQLLAFSRKQIVRPKILDLNELLTDIEKMLCRLIGEDIELLTIPGPELWQVETDPGQMEQVIMNLVVNARDVMPMGGKLTVETANMDLDENYFRKHGIIEELPGTYVMLAVSDTGSGMDKETQEHIFEPFYTTKEIGKGTGLGLSTVYGIVKQNNGFIWTYSEPGQGTTFKVYLPKAKRGVEEKEKKRTPVLELGGSETVLIVEDDNSLRKLALKALQQKGYKVLEAENGEDALRISKEHEGPIDLMLTDVVMPKMGGRETAERLQPLYPQMKVIYMSGYTDNAIVHHGVLEPGLNFLEKPFTPEGLARKVREVLDK